MANNNNIYNQLHEIESIPQNLLSLGISSYIKKTRTLKERASQISCLDDILTSKNKRDNIRFLQHVGYSRDHVRVAVINSGELRSVLDKQVKVLIYGKR